MRALKIQSAFPSFSVVVFLPIILLLLVIASIAPVIVVSAHVASDTSNQLAVDQARSVIAGMERELRGLFEPITGQLRFLQRSVVEGRIDASNRDGLKLFALGLLASSPQIQTAEVSWPNGGKSRWTRYELGKPPKSTSIAPRPSGFMDINLVEESQSASPILRMSFDDRFVKIEIGLEYHGRQAGVVSVEVSTSRLSRYVNDAAAQFDVIPFIVSDRDQWVMKPTDIATLAERLGWSLTATRRVIDRSISNFWMDRQPLADVPDLPGVKGHWSKIDGQSYVYVYRAVTNLGPRSLIAAVAIRSGHVQWGWWITHIGALLGCGDRRAGPGCSVAPWTHAGPSDGRHRSSAPINRTVRFRPRFADAPVRRKGHGVATYGASSGKHRSSSVSLANVYSANVDASAVDQPRAGGRRGLARGDRHVSRFGGIYQILSPASGRRGHDPPQQRLCDRRADYRSQWWNHR